MACLYLSGSSSGMGSCDFPSFFIFFLFSEICQASYKTKEMIMIHRETENEDNWNLPCDPCGLWPPHIHRGIAFGLPHTPVLSMLCWPLRRPTVPGLCSLDFCLDAPKTIGCDISFWFVRLMRLVQLARPQTDLDWNRWIQGEANDLFAAQMSIQHREPQFSSPYFIQKTIFHSKKIPQKYWECTIGMALFIHLLNLPLNSNYQMNLTQMLRRLTFSRYPLPLHIQTKTRLNQLSNEIFADFYLIKYKQVLLLLLWKHKTMPNNENANAPKL